MNSIFRYKQNVVELSRLVKDQPMKPLDKAVWWIEYAIRNKGTKHLHYPGLDVPFYQYLYLDVIFIYVVLIAIILLTIRFVIRWFIRHLRKFMKLKVKQQ